MRQRACTCTVVKNGVRSRLYFDDNCPQHGGSIPPSVDATAGERLLEAEAHIVKLRGVLLHYWGTTDPELLGEVWEDRLASSAPTACAECARLRDELRRVHGELNHANADADWFKQSAHTRAKQIDAIRNDAGILDWLESVLTPATPATEVYLAGLRSGPRDAESFQCEMAPAGGEWQSFQGKGLREAIAAARAARHDGCRAASQEGRHE